MEHHTGHDLENRDDVEFFLRSFYGRVLIHPFLAEKFTGVNMEQHIPVITSFWTSIILFEGEYTGNMMDKHRSMDLSPEHFTTWLGIFYEVMDELFSGPNATEMKKRAASIAGVLQHKLGITGTA